jgi:hypothetical protein
MRIRPFGLHKKTVNAFMKRIQNSHEQDLARLSGEITSAALHRDKLVLMLQTVNQEQLAQELKDKLREELKTELRSELTTEIRVELKIELREEVHEELRREHQEVADQPAETDQDSPFSKTGKVLHFKQGGVKLRIVPRAQPEPLSDSAPIPIPRKKQVKAVGMGFWENADDYLEPAYIEDQQFFIPNAYANTYTAPQGTLAFFETLPSAMEEVAVTMDAPPAAPKQLERMQPRMEPVKRQEEFPEQTAIPKGDTVSAPSTGTSKQSPAITEEIRMIRQKYIVGKIAGEDVYDSTGKLIIAKQSLITGEVVDKADAEGKLAELIVHMIIPGLGED